MSWIDHILSYSPAPIEAVRVTLGQGPYWANISDHRPLTAWFTGPCISSLGSAMAYTHDPPPCITRRSLPPILVPEFAKEVKTNFEAWKEHLEPRELENPGELLREITALSVRAVPQAPISQLLHMKYRGGWSPILMALDAKLVAITTIIYRIQGIGKGTWWRTPLEQGVGIRTAINKWESTVRKL